MLGRALKSLKKKAASKFRIVQMLIQPLACDVRDLQPYLRRMDLQLPRGFEERLYARLLRAELCRIVAGQIRLASARH